MIKDPAVRRAYDIWKAHPTLETQRRMNDLIRVMKVDKPPEWTEADNQVHRQHAMDGAYCPLCESF